MAVFAYSMASRGKIGISVITRILYGSGGKKKGEKPRADRFATIDFRQLITDMHKAVKRTKCENEDFRKIISLYVSKTKKHCFIQIVLIFQPKVMDQSLLRMI